MFLIILDMSILNDNSYEENDFHVMKYITILEKPFHNLELRSKILDLIDPKIFMTISSTMEI